MENYQNIGKIVSTFGIKGELVLEHHLGAEPGFGKIKALFLEETHGKFIPYFLETHKNRKAGETLVLLEGISTPEKARLLVRKKVWLPEIEVKKIAEESSPISWLGFVVFDGKKKLGEVLEVIEQPAQILLRLEINEKEVLIPLNESTLEKIDISKQQIKVKLPEGLLDIYLT
jgi:16S rRNA processing protein RimM